MKSVSILGHKFRVDIDATLDAGEYGDTCSRTKVIRLNPRLSEEVKLETLWHEVLHASLGISGLSHVLTADLEEAVVSCIENATWELISKGVFTTK